MRRTSSSHGFFLCFILNLFLNFEWGLLALLLWILHLLLGIPWFLPLMGLAVWLLIAFFATFLINWGRSASEPTPERENRNPYSARNEDVFGRHQAPAEDIEDEVDYTEYLWEAMRRIGVSQALFTELVRQVRSGERDPEYNPDSGLLSLEDEMYYFLDGLCDMNYIAYHDHADLCEDVADSLTRSAEQQGLPPIPEGLLETHPMMPDPHSPTGRSEMLGGMAAVYIAGKVIDWRIFTIDDGSDSLYVGVVSHANAGVFLNRTCTYFLETGCTYCARLLGGEEEAHV